VETAGIEPTPALVQTRRPATGIPEMRTGGVEPPQQEAAALQAAELAACSAFACAGRPAGFEPAPAGVTGPDADRYTTATTNWQSRCGGDDRTRTGDLSVDNRPLFSSELRPQVARVGFEPTVSSS
jgi:hypothetical protein